MDITTQVLTQAAKDHLTLAQQMATTNDMVARLAADQGGDMVGEGSRSHSSFVDNNQ
jgi:hypothetical protein